MEGWLLRLRTFGGLSLEGPPADAPSPGRRSLSLLALLATARNRALSRDKIVGLLWPESDSERGRNSLSQALSAIRRGTGVDDVVVGTAELRLNASVIASDVDEFEGHLAAGRLEQAAELYAGPFLDGVFLKEAPEFDRWVEDARSRFRRLTADALHALAELADREARHDAAVTQWRRLVAIEPTSGRWALGLMKALAASGDRNAALEYFRVHELLLRQEIDVEPEEQVAKFAALLRSARSPSIDVPVATTPVAPPVVAAVASPQPDRSPVFDGTTSQSPSAARHGRSRATRLRARMLWIAASVACVAAVIFAFRSAPSHSYKPDRIVVAGFLNRTGDSTLNAFGFLTADFVVDGLQRSGLGEVTDVATAALSSDLNDTTTAADEPRHTRELAQATHARLVVTGHYFKQADSVAVVARVTDAARGRLVGVTEPVLVAPYAPSDGLRQMRERVLGIIATRLDERIADVLPPGASSPPSLPAYAEYLKGLLEFQSRKWAMALPHFKRAYELDSSFVAPLMWQAFALGSLGRNGERQAVVLELARHRSQLTPLDSHALDYFEAYPRKDFRGELDALQQAAKLAPGSIWTYNLANLLVNLGRDDEAVPVFEQIDLSHGWIRNWPTYYGSYARALHYVNYKRELEVNRMGRRAFSDAFAFVVDEGRALAALGRRDELESILRELEGMPSSDGPGPGAPAPGNALDQIAMELWSRGDTAYSHEVSQRSLRWFDRLPPDEATRPAVRFARMNALYDADRWAEACTIAEDGVKAEPDNWGVLTTLGLCLARQGERERAEAVLSRFIAAGDSADGVANYLTLAAYPEARIAAVLGERERAVSFLREINVRTGGLFPRHVQNKDFDGLADYAPYLAVTRPVP